MEILAEDIPGWAVGNAGDLTVALDVTITPELQAEGNARELVNRIQNIRKDRDFEITDKVKVVLARTPLTEAALGSFADYIASQVLASELTLGQPAGDVTVMEIDGQEIPVSVTRV